MGRIPASPPHSPQNPSSTCTGAPHEVQIQAIVVGGVATPAGCGRAASGVVTPLTVPVGAPHSRQNPAVLSTGVLHIAQRRTGAAEGNVIAGSG